MVKTYERNGCFMMRQQQLDVCQVRASADLWGPAACEGLNIDHNLVHLGPQK